MQNTGPLRSGYSDQVVTLQPRQFSNVQFFAHRLKIGELLTNIA